MQRGDIVLQRNTFAKPKCFLTAIEPFRDDLVVAAECMFRWYWFADLCERERIPFVLGHALYMKAIHGGKTKNDRVDAHKIAVLLRGGMFPLAHVYPRGEAGHARPAPPSDPLYAQVARGRRRDQRWPKGSLNRQR